MAARREEERAAAEAPEPRVLRGDRRPKRNVLAKVGIGLIGLMLLATAALTRRPKPPDLAADCTKPAFALASPSRQNRPTAFTMVGPRDKRYVLTVNTAGVVRGADGVWRPVPLPGKPREQVFYVSDKPMKDCLRTGVLNMAVPLGEHLVTMYELTDGSSADEVQRVTVQVVAPEEDDVEVPR